MLYAFTEKPSTIYYDTAKGKSAIEIAKHFEKVRKITGESFWARGYFVSTVGVGEREIRLYIGNQEKEDRKVEQLKLL